MTDREPVDVTKEQLTVLCVKPGEKPKRIEIESSLDALQRAVGGYIEAVYPYEDPVALTVNAQLLIMCSKKPECMKQAVLWLK